MKKLLILLLLTPFTAWGQSVMCFNIRYDNPQDGVNIWAHRRGAVVEMLREQQCDIIGLQEVLSTQLDYLSDSLTRYDWVGVGRDDGARGGEYAPIFYRTDRFKLLFAGNHWLSATPALPSLGWDAACIRVATWAVLEGEQGEQLVVINTHFDHVGQVARAQSAHIIVALADSLQKANRGAQVIFMGDLNSTLQDKALRPILRSFANTRPRGTMATPYTFIGFDNRESDRCLIDHIFVRGLKVKSYQVVANSSSVGFLSDHLPVKVVVEPCAL
ncbi:MAG: endonuclease/exonuclease/phosphatase family protein [Mucinivorans sp.]